MKIHVRARDDLEHALCGTPTKHLRPWQLAKKRLDVVTCANCLAKLYAWELAWANRYRGTRLG